VVRHVQARGRTLRRPARLPTGVRAPGARQRVQVRSGHGQLAPGRLRGGPAAQPGQALGQPCAQRDRPAPAHHAQSKLPTRLPAHCVPSVTLPLPHAAAASGA